MGFLKGKIHSKKFITADITDADDRLYHVPIKHKIGNFFLAELDHQYYAFSMKDARIVTHRSNSGIGEAYQVIQYDTSHVSPLNPTTKELEIMLGENDFGRLDRNKHGILSVLANREKKNFGKWICEDGKEFDTEEEAKEHSEGAKKPMEYHQIIHDIDDLVKVFDNEKGDYPQQAKEIKAYLKTLDIKQIVTPVRKITEFIEDDLIATNSNFLGEGVARAQRLDGTLRQVTNVPVKPKGNMMMFLVVGLIIGVGVLGVYALSESGALDGVTAFTDNLGTIQDGFKGLPAPGQFQTAGKIVEGVDHSDGAIQSKYPDCNALKIDIDRGIYNYDLLSSSMQGFIDSCPAPKVTAGN